MEAALNGPLGRTFLEPTVLTIGSSPDNQLVMHSATVAEHQAEIRPEGQGFSITDLGSTGGTFVNGQRLDWNTPRLLNPGDSITIGDTTFTYEADGMPLPHVSSGQPHGVPLAAESGQPQGSSLPSAPASPGTGNYDGDAAPWEHTAYGSGLPSGMQPQQPYGPAYPQQPFMPSMYQGNIPGYPGAVPGYAEPATPPAARRRSIWIWISLVIIIALILGGGAYFYFSRSTPERTLDAYCQALQAQNYVAAYNQLASSLQKTQTEPQYAGVSQALGKVSTCTHG
jgi:hypothetical protein